jgi:hypothetical protein
MVDLAASEEAIVVRPAELDANPFLFNALNGTRADYIGAPRSRVCAPASAGRIPVERDGSALICRQSELDAWLRAGGGRRP